MISLNVNGVARSVDVSPDTPLLWVLRDLLGLTGTKFGCGMALCGACTVHVDGVPTRSCVTPVSSLAGKKITTIEALSQSQKGQLLQKAWIEEQVPQCGYCQSGQLMTAISLLQTHPSPTDAQIDAAMAPVICRCGTYTRVRKAIARASGRSSGA